jgi:thiamine kinase-like enzyme
MQITINLQKLAVYGNTILKRSGTLWTLKTTKITDGYVAFGVYRHDVLFHLDDGSSETVSFIQKFTNAGEVQVMRALSELTTEETIPQMIDYAMTSPTTDEEFANWFIIPFYEGSFLTFEDEVPSPIIESLARIHVYFTSRVEEFDYRYRVDKTFFRRTIDNALESLEKANDERPNSIFAKAQHHLKTVREAQILYKALERLPVTLTHGDVHPGNIIQSPDGYSILFDWGNARVAPAMLDLANMVKIDSANWDDYLSAYEVANGEAIDPEIARLGYVWATVMVNAQYLPYAVNYLPPERTQEMMGHILYAVERLAAGA